MIGRTNHTQFASADASATSGNSAATNESSQTTLPLPTATDTPQATKTKLAHVNIIDVMQSTITSRTVDETIKQACHSPQQFQTNCDELRSFIAAHGLDAVKEAIKLYKTQQGLK